MMAELKKASVKSKVEAVLFSTGHRIILEEISKLCRSRKEEVLLALQELRKEYEDKQSSLMLVEEGDFWKLTVRDHLMPIVRKIVTETELTKSIMETLAVIAFKYPILQSDLIKLRTNKAYDHLTELEASGYISRQKHGRTNLIKLTEKFFKYFDLTEEKLKDHFKDFESIAKAIKEKENEIDILKEDQQKKAEDLKKEDEKIRKEIETLDKSEEDFEIPLQTYESKSNEVISEEFQQEGNLIVEKEKIGELEVVNEEKKVKKEQTAAIEQKQIPAQEKVPSEIPQTQKQEQVQAQEKKQIFEEKVEAPKKQKNKKEGIKMTPEMEKKVDERVDEIMGVKQKSREENNKIG